MNVSSYLLGRKSHHVYKWNEIIIKGNIALVYVFHPARPKSQNYLSTCVTGVESMDI